MTLAAQVFAQRQQCVHECCGSTLSFLSIGDWGEPGSQQKKVAEKMAAEADTSGPIDFLVMAGDNFYPDGVKTWDDPQWKTTYTDVYDAKSLQVPHFVVLGNHDYRTSVDAQVERSQYFTSNWVMPARWYTKEFTLGCLPDTAGRSPAGSAATSIRFIFIDTEVLAAGRSNRIRNTDRYSHWVWLEEQLRGSQADWIVVVGHHPVFSSGQHGDTPGLLQRLLPLLEHYGVDLYISGHDHDQQLLISGGTKYMLTGSGSKLRPGPDNADHSKLHWYGGFYGFTSTYLNSSHISVSYHSEEGKQEFGHLSSRVEKKNKGVPLVDWPGATYVVRWPWYGELGSVLLGLLGIGCLFYVYAGRRKLCESDSHQLELTEATPITARRELSSRASRISKDGLGIPA